MQVENFLEGKNVCHMIFYIISQDVGPRLGYVEGLADLQASLEYLSNPFLSLTMPPFLLPPARR